MGDVLCQILSYAHCKDGPTRTPKNIVKNLAALRMRVNRTVQARAMARYELSLQGDWPSDLCASSSSCSPVVVVHLVLPADSDSVPPADASLQALQMCVTASSCLCYLSSGALTSQPFARREMLDQLGQFCAVLSKLDAKWTKALLHRTQFANPRFLQDVLTTLYLISGALGALGPPPLSRRGSSRSRPRSRSCCARRSRHAAPMDLQPAPRALPQVARGLGVGPRVRVRLRDPARRRRRRRRPAQARQPRDHLLARLLALLGRRFAGLRRRQPPRPSHGAPSSSPTPLSLSACPR